MSFTVSTFIEELDEDGNLGVCRYSVGFDTQEEVDKYLEYVRVNELSLKEPEVKPYQPITL